MKYISGALLAAAFLSMGAGGRTSELAPAQPIPKGFDFPRDGCELHTMVEKGNKSGLRRHSWNVFAGMTQPASNHAAGPPNVPKTPIWLTWHSDVSTFSANGSLAEHGTTLHVHLEQARQLGAALQQARKPDACDPGARIVSVLFDEHAYQHIINRQPWNGADLMQDCGTHVPGSVPKPPTVVLNNRASKDRYVKALNPVFVRGMERASIPAFQPESVAVKAVWWLVPKGQYTALPVWDGIPERSAEDAVFPLCSWKRRVIIDPDINHRQPVPPSGHVLFGGQEITNARTVSVRDFFFYEIDAQGANEWNNLRSREMPLARIGDYLVLVAMHFTTKEIVDWTWATFWWHDSPDRGEFAADRPSSVRNAWAHYLMNVSYDTNLPLEPDGTPHICFNPWLEGLFPAGHTSNCMTCHRLSVWPAGPFLPVTRGNLSAAHPLFMWKAKLDYLWSLAQK